MTVTHNNPAALQTLRTIDKVDRIGWDGVQKILTEPLPQGPGLHPTQAALLCGILKAKNYITSAPMLLDRINIMTALDADTTKDASGRTAWERLLEMPANADETWNDGKRPANIAWALDDLVGAARKVGQDDRGCA